MDEQDFQKHKKLIDLILEDEQEYLLEDKPDTIKIIKKLKANGLLKLFFSKPRMIQVTFQTGGNAQFFIKLLRDTLRSIGYYRYFTTQSKRDNSSFTWQIQFKSEYVIDPVVLEEALKKRNCTISSIRRIKADDWSYSIDIENANLSLEQLYPNQQMVLKKSLRPYWVDISLGQKLSIHSIEDDAWYPDVAIFDEKMRLLKVYKRKQRTKELVFYLPKESVYMKISDVFTQGNIKHGLQLLLEGEK